MLADNALTTLDRMKLMLGLSDIEDERTDEIVTLLINRASSWIERQIGRHLGKRSYRQFYDADGQQELVTLEYLSSALSTSRKTARKLTRKAMTMLKRLRLGLSIVTRAG